MNAETFAGTFSEVKRKLDEWKDANPKSRIIREGPATAAGDNAIKLDDPAWILTIEYEESAAN